MSIFKYDRLREPQTCKESVSTFYRAIFPNGVWLTILVYEEPKLKLSKLVFNALIFSRHCKKVWAFLVKYCPSCVYLLKKGHSIGSNATMMIMVMLSIFSAKLMYYNFPPNNVFLPYHEEYTTPNTFWVKMMCLLRIWHRCRNRSYIPLLHCGWSARQAGHYHCSHCRIVTAHNLH